MNLFLIYLIGCVLSFGITHTFTIPYNNSDMSNFRIYTYGVLSSWLTVLMFIVGVIRGIVKGVTKDGD